MIDKKKIIERAKLISITVHWRQTRWDKKTPYIVHPEAVANKFTDWKKVSVSWLHDVLEDSDMCVADLHRLNFPDCIINAVVSITKLEEETYLNYILRVKKNRIARKVKIRDILHNISTMGEKKGNLFEKWNLALYLLKNTGGLYE